MFEKGVMAMHSAVAFFIVMLFLAIGDFISTKTKALIPSILVFLILMLAMVWPGFLPVNTIELAGFTPYLTNMILVIIVANMGSSLKLGDLFREWKTVIIALAAILGVGLTVLTLGSAIFGRQAAIVAAPPITGGIIAANEMAESAKAIGKPELATIALLILAVQSIPAYFLVPSFLKKEAAFQLKQYKEIGCKIPKAKKPFELKRLIPPIPDKYNTPATIFATLGFVGFLAIEASKLSGKLFGLFGSKFTISATIFGLLFGVIAGEIGLVERKAMAKAKSDGYLMIASLLGVLGGLIASKPAEIVAALPVILGMILIGILGIAIVSIIVGKLLKRSWYMSFALGLNCLLGFPLNYQLTHEAIKSAAGDDTEYEYLMEQISPSMLVGGFVTVTIGSVLFAGILKNML